MASKPNTLVDRLWKSIKNNKAIAVLIVAGASVIALGQFTNAVKDVTSYVSVFFHRQINSEARKSERSPCATEEGAIAIRAYSMAVAYPDALPPFVREHAKTFAVDGAGVKCLNSLASKIRSLPPQQEDHRRKKRVDKSVDKLEPALDDWPYIQPPHRKEQALLVAQLAEVLPQLAKGESAPYHSTFVYTTSVRVWLLLKTSNPTDMNESRERIAEEIDGNFRDILMIPESKPSKP